MNCLVSCMCRLLPSVQGHFCHYTSACCIHYGYDVGSVTRLWSLLSSNRSTVVERVVPLHTGCQHKHCCIHQRNIWKLQCANLQEYQGKVTMWLGQTLENLQNVCKWTLSLLGLLVKRKEVISNSQMKTLIGMNEEAGNIYFMIWYN